MPKVVSTEAKPNRRAWFESLDDSSERYDLDEVVYTDSKGGLLQVVHDMDELKKTSGEEWKEHFQGRARRNEWPYGSGVWGKKEWVLPDIDNENVVSMYEGHTNLFWAERYGREIGIEDLWLKLCGNSHTGSFKDLGMTVLVSQVKQMIANGGRHSGGRVRVDGGYLCSALGIRRRRRNPCHRLPAPRQNFPRAVDSARGEWRDRLRSGYGLRRLHGYREEGLCRRRCLSREFDE